MVGLMPRFSRKYTRAECLTSVCTQTHVVALNLYHTLQVVTYYQVYIIERGMSDLRTIFLVRNTDLCINTSDF